jgi:hypothetical protein
MIKTSQLASFRQLHEEACLAVVQAAGGELSWEDAYDRVFNVDFQARLRATAINYDAHWADPDTSYEGALTDTLHEVVTRPTAPDPVMHAYLVRFTRTLPNALSSVLFKGEANHGSVVITAESEDQAREVLRANLREQTADTVTVTGVQQLDGAEAALHAATLQFFRN